MKALEIAKPGVVQLVDRPNPNPRAISANQALASPTRITVAADGSGDFCSIQAAIDSLPVAGRERFLQKPFCGLVCNL